MKKRNLLLSLLGSVVVSCAAGDDGSGSDLSNQRSTLQVPGLTPYPCDENFRSTWDGTPVQLLLADAWASCTLVEIRPNTNQQYAGHNLWLSSSDDQLTEVADRVKSTLVAMGYDGQYVDPLEDWANVRRGELNCDPAGTNTARVAAPLTLTPPTAKVADIASNIVADYPADLDLRTAQISLCIAEKLRSESPGGTAGAALLLDAASQRELAQVTAKRAEMAVAHFSQLVSAFAVTNTSAPPSQDATTDAARLYWLWRWIQTPRGYVPGTEALRNWNTTDLQAMGRDFASAVQLATVLGRESMDLAARSRSARLPYQAAATVNLADESWGPASWHQRTLATAYGGDPLSFDTAVAGSSNPWPYTLPLSTNLGGTIFSAYRYTWPSKGAAPYVSARDDAPEQGSVLSLAKRFDAIRLVLDLTTSENCATIDTEASVDPLWLELEKSLRRLHCEEPASPGTAVSDACGATGLMPPGNDDESLLWQLYRVRHSHVSGLVGQLAELVGPTLDITGAGACGDLRFGAVLPKDADIDLMQIDPAPPASYTGSVLKLHRQADFRPRGPANVAPNYARFGQVRLWEADELFRDISLASQGFANRGVGSFNPPDIAGSSKRRLGSLGVFAGSRILLEDSTLRADAMTGARGTNLRALLSLSPDIQRLMRAASGDTAFVFKPQMRRNGTGVQVRRDSNRALWSLKASVSPKDTFWNAETDGLSYYAIAVPTNSWAEHLVAAPHTRIMGRDIQSVLSSGVALRMQRGAETEDFVHYETPEGCTLFSCSGLPLNTATNIWSLVVWRTTQANYEAVRAGSRSPSPEAEDLMMVGSNLRFEPALSTAAFHFAYEGALGDFVAKQSKSDPFNPARHQYDGFGLPESWVPPFNAELLGGGSQESSVSYFLSSAERSAQSAREAVDLAMSGLLDQAGDDAALEAAVARGQQTMLAAQEGLCGTTEPNCSVEVSAPRRLDVGWYPALSDDKWADHGTLGTDECADLPIGFPPASGDTEGNITIDGPSPAPDVVIPAGDANISSNDTKLAKKIIRCFVKERIHSFLGAETQLASPVEETLDSKSQPAFAEFSGGTLQSAFIEQWRAIKSPDEQFDSVRTQLESGNARIDAASAVVARAEKIIQINCGVTAVAMAVAAGVECGVPSGCSWSPAPLHAQQNKCQEVLADAAPAVANQTAALYEGMSAVASSAIGLTNAAAAIASSGASITAQLNQAGLAKEQAALEVKLSATTTRTSFGLYRRIHDYDLWRARALLENSRRYAVAARRAIEARYVVDLSALSGEEAFVSSPASWADEVYEYDLSLPAAVGLAVSAQNSSGDGTVYSNKVVDYVANLRAFADGFSVQRPTAIAQQDVDVVTLPGLSPEIGEPYLFEGQEGSVEVPLSESSAAWTVYCPAGTLEGKGWHGVPAPEVGGVQLACRQSDCESSGCDSVESCIAACSVRPERARLSFRLDPWGRLNGSVLEPPYAKRYNGRWQQLAVNLVGTGVRDCTASADPLSCYNEGYVRYNLSHVGRAWVTDFSAIWRSQGVPLGIVEGGKALAAELWLDPLKDGWGSSYISAVARSEFFYRPLGGEYLLDVEAGEDMRLERIERVQFLVGTSYWVQQQ